jgi:hypothetical protein
MYLCVLVLIFVMLLCVRVYVCYLVYVYLFEFVCGTAENQAGNYLSKSKQTDMSWLTDFIRVLRDQPFDGVSN